LHLRAAALLLLPLTATAQPEDTLVLSAYVDAYYAAYSNAAPDELQPYITVGARHNTLSLNVAQLGLHYTHERVRANFTYHTGDIVSATWADRFTNVQEANVGVNLGGNWWFDAGLFRTHIGAESFLPKNIHTSSTAFVTYNEPFYQAGARVSYAAGDKWQLEGWLLNGYNQFVDDNEAKSFGLLATYAPSERTSFTYTNLLGNEAEPGLGRRQFRVYQNAYWEQQWGNRFSSLLGVDVGTQSNSQLVVDGEEALLYATLLSFRYAFTERWSLSGRGEVFRDRTGFISGIFFTPEGRQTGAKMNGLTLGTEFRPHPTTYLRAEGRYVTTADGFRLAGEERRWELLLTAGVAVEKEVF
jgi:hypothetical protein